MLLFAFFFLGCRADTSVRPYISAFSAFAYHLPVGADRCVCPIHWRSFAVFCPRFSGGRIGPPLHFRFPRFRLSFACRGRPVCLPNPLAVVRGFLSSVLGRTHRSAPTFPLFPLSLIICLYGQTGVSAQSIGGRSRFFVLGSCADTSCRIPTTFITLSLPVPPRKSMWSMRGWGRCRVCHIPPGRGCRQSNGRQRAFVSVQSASPR